MLVIVFCVAGLAVGIVRVAPGSTALDIPLAAAAGALGAVTFAFVARVGKRGTPPWTKWLIVPILIGAFYLDRLSERAQLALLALAAGYTGAVVTVVARVKLMRHASRARAARAAPRRGASAADLHLQLEEDVVPSSCSISGRACRSP